MRKPFLRLCLFAPILVLFLGQTCPIDTGGDDSGDGGDTATKCSPIIPAKTLRQTFDAEDLKAIDALASVVIPFNPAEVKNWSGSPNVGNTCFFNAANVVMAAFALLTAAELQPNVEDDPTDIANGLPVGTTAAVRTGFRKLINLIRAGSASPAKNLKNGKTELDAKRLVIEEYIEAMEKHPNLQTFARKAQADSQEYMTRLFAALRIGANVLDLGNDPFTVRTEIVRWPLTIQADEIVIRRGDPYFLAQPDYLFPLIIDGPNDPANPPLRAYIIIRNLEDAFKHYSKNVWLDGDEAIGDPEDVPPGVRKPGLQRSYITRLPAALLVNIKRYINNNALTNYIMDYQDPIPVDVYTKPDPPFDAGNNDYKPQNTVDLHPRAMVIQYGATKDGGHYAAKIRDNGDIWYRFDDSSVTQLKIEEVGDDTQDIDDGKGGKKKALTGRMTTVILSP